MIILIKMQHYLNHLLDGCYGDQKYNVVYSLKNKKTKIYYSLIHNSEAVISSTITVGYNCIDNLNVSFIN
jgi:hypothetical protein